MISTAHKALALLELLIAAKLQFTCFISSFSLDLASTCLTNPSLALQSVGVNYVGVVLDCAHAQLSPFYPLSTL